MDDYIEEVNFMNNTNFIKNDLFCSICCSLFVEKLYTDGITKICQGCYAKVMLTSPKVEAVCHKQRLDIILFPCKFEFCNYIGRSCVISDHQKICLYGPIVCPFDNKVFENDFINMSKFLKSDFVEHLFLHGKLRTIITDNLKLIVPIDVFRILNNFRFIFLVMYKIHYFIVFVELVDDAILFRVAKYCTNDNPIENFTVVHQYKNKKTIVQGNVISLQSVFNDTDTEKDVRLHKTMIENNQEVIIYFYDYEELKCTFPECPICLHTLNDELRHCQNGHAVCASCGAKITTCPICRVPMEEKMISIARLFPDIYFQCNHYDNGCLSRFKSCNKNDHYKICDFETISCPKCNIECKRRSIYYHFNDEHTCYKNFSTFVRCFKTEFDTSIPILYRSNIFYLKMAYNNKELSMQMLLINAPEASAAKYRYEIHLQKDNVNVAKTGNMCVPMNASTTKKITSVIKLEPLETIFFQNDMWSLKFQCNICLLTID